MPGIGLGLSPSVNNNFFSPLSVPETVAWFSAIYGVTNSSGAASAWADVTNTFSASQAIGSRRPTITTNIGGNNTLTFTSSNLQKLINTTQNLVTSGTTRYVLIAGKGADGYGGSFITFRTSTAGATRVWSIAATDLLDTNFYYFTDAETNNCVDHAGAAGKPNLVQSFVFEYELTANAVPVVRFNNSSRTIDGTINVSGEDGATGFILGGRELSSQFWNGDITDIYVASTIPSTTNKAKLRTFFGKHVGVIL